MRFLPLDVPGAYLVEPDPSLDERGLFARTYDAELFRAAGLPLTTSQSIVAYNHLAGTIRGLHWQDEGAPETKLVRCTRGAVLDVLVDRRPASAGVTASIQLSADDRRAVYVPPMVAHGYQTLADATELTYDIEGSYAPSAARGLRFDDPALGLSWPLPVTVVSARDRAWPLL